MASPWIDISYPIENGVAQWPGDIPIRVTRRCEIGPDSFARLSKLDFVSHFLTHVDAPSHFIQNGEELHEVSLDRWSGEAVVVEVKDEVIEEHHIPADCKGLCVLFKSRNWQLWSESTFQKNYVYVSGPAARLLVERGAKLVGVDYMTVDKWGVTDFPAHYALLGSGVVILEGVDLRNIEPGPYELVAFPLRITGCDGSPVRAALRKRG